MSLRRSNSSRKWFNGVQRLGSTLMGTRNYITLLDRFMLKVQRADRISILAKLTFFSRYRALRCRATSNPRHQRLSRSPRPTRVRLVRSRRLSYRRPVLRAMHFPLLADQQPPLREQGVPDLHLALIFLQQSLDGARSLKYFFRHAHISFIALTQLPWAAATGSPER